MKVLTQILINKKEAAQQCIIDSYAWHKALWHSFAHQDVQERPFLFRRDDRRLELRILMLSLTLPQKQRWGKWHIKFINEPFLTHSVYSFQLKANPTLRRSHDRRRLGIYKESKLREWMTRKAFQNGFELDRHSLVIGPPMAETFIRNGSWGKHVAVDFKGKLQVTDRKAFKNAFKSGIGSAKSFGYGLLMISPHQCQSPNNRLRAESRYTDGSN